MEDVTLPNLPGYVNNTVDGEDFSKSHLFDVLDGLSYVEPNKFEEKPSNMATIPTGDQFYEKENDFGVPDKSQTAKKVSGSVNVLPKWIAFDGCVLRFWAWTAEDVIFSNDEKLRYRQFRIFFYLEDNTVQISEEKFENSGISQGLFLKRQKVPACDADRFMNWKDFSVASVLTVFGREFNVIKCDDFTRQFYSKMGVKLAENEEFPMDVYTLGREAAKEHPVPDTTISGYAEAISGKRAHWQYEQEKRFLAHDQKVLRFWAIWNDPQVFGETHRYTVLYYISDDTMSVHEIYPQNAGLHPFPSFLTRRKLPKQMPETGVALIGESHQDIQDYYTHGDLRVGGYITILGRHMLLMKADEYTKCFYKDVHGMVEEDFQEIEETKREYVIPKNPIPPHNGYGTEEDSLGSIKYLVPRKPRKDYIKLLKYDNVVMRFSAKLENASLEDSERRFVIEFFRCDDTIKIFETRVPNSGFTGGKFLERTKLRNAATGTWYQASEFFVGADPIINGYHFKLLEADESTMDHMESDSNFAFADKDRILQKLADKLWDRANHRTQTFRLVDSNHDHYISRKEFEDMMKMYGWRLNEHELLTIWRCYSENGDEHITADRFFKVLERYKHGKQEA